MAKRRKHQFHCEQCGSPCEIYRKGKKHRVLVCPQCGVLATNPISLGKLGRIAKAGGKLIPGVGTAIAAAELAGEVFGKDKKGEEVPVQTTKRRAGFDYVKWALGTR